MSEQYILQENLNLKQHELETAVMINEGIIWEDATSEPNASLTFLQGQETILTDTINESYCTAIDDDENNTTQYFSILGSPNETVLSDMNITIANGQEDASEIVDVGDQQVVLCNVDGDLYGFQVAEDEDGNLQKYQFQIRQNEQGQLEAVPESIQVLPIVNEEEISDATSQVEMTDTDLNETLTESGSRRIVVKREYPPEEILSDVPQFESIPNTSEVTACEDIKAGIIEQQQTFTSPNNNHNKQPQPSNEPEGKTETTARDQEAANDHEGHYEQVFVQENHIVEHATRDCVDENQAQNYCEPVLSHDDEETSQDTAESVRSQDVVESESGNESESENEYQIVEGLHITADTEDDALDEVDAVEELIPKSQLPSNSKYLKNIVQNIALKEVQGNFDNDVNKSMGYFIIKHPEKENVLQHTNVKLHKSNPRSILKSSFGIFPDTNEQIPPIEDRTSNKTRESIQARLFNNYIATTSILQAPIRQERLPRKQTIKPVERTDEEIIVQEVVVSSNGFIETSVDGILKSKEPLKPVEYLNVTDSDDDYDPRKSRHRRKKKGRKSRIEIVISDSDGDESEDDVIRVDSSEKSDDEDDGSVPVKRGRGRPRKSNVAQNTQSVLYKRKRGRPPKSVKSSTSDESYDELNNIQKELQRNEKDENLPNKNEIQCTKCTKTFPSQGSLKTHMQYHNFRESSRRTTTCEKYKCPDCDATFINTFLLNKHKNDHKTLGCTVCKKVLPDRLQLSSHMRAHKKTRMVKTTTIPKISPKKSRNSSTVANTSLTTTSKRTCDDCGRVCKNAREMEGHRKIHKRFVCGSCSSSFVSKLMLDNHVRLKCVKSPAAFKKPMVPALRPSTKNSLTVGAPLMSPLVSPKSPKNVSGLVPVNCEDCSETFSSFTNLLKHKVLKHGLDTPDKTILQNKKKTLCRVSAIINGMPATNKQKIAYMNLKRKLAEKEK